ncbi:TetR/AcrR family transcriptional regulator [Hymenobacter terrenus]|uniref:TetR/AcrR family transcriptional regulator n=1 Tax=Hymenobacter terrenus TaxID=1629124 RepID=UPI0006972DBA|nr:TetR/AcrR family transcriptional regulator [Hymenobacter terrenus]
MKDEILHSALQLAEREGWDQVSTRRITKEFGYTTSAIYYYLGSKDHLLVELQRQGFRQLRAVMQAAANQHPANNPAQLQAISLAFWVFAFAHRTLYELMFGLAPVTCKGDAGTEILEAGEVVQAVLRRLSSADPMDLFLHWWALATGFVGIGLTVPVDRQAHVQGLFAAGISQFIQAL